ncbi:MAG: NifU N-terminal domain-containing protein [Phycisphaerales bacterium]
MPPRVTEFVPTPNPNALKCVVEGSLGAGPRSFSAPADAASDPIARMLLSIPGVKSVLIHDAWFTVSKSPDADWKAIKAAISRSMEHA